MVSCKSTFLSLNSTFLPFWLLGLFNNGSYVILLACAKSISDGGTALVFLALVVPGLTMKLSAPYWFDRVGYNKRLMMSTAFMTTSFMIVGFVSAHTYDSGSGTKTKWQLFGVAFASLQCSLGEASLLALAGKYDSCALKSNEAQNDGNKKSGNITAYSSGTGLAGVFGFAWKVILNDWFKLSFSATVVLANVLPVSYWSTYWFYFREELQEKMVMDLREEEDYVLQEGYDEDGEIPVAISETSSLKGRMNGIDDEDGVEMYQNITKERVGEDFVEDDNIDGGTSLEDNPTEQTGAVRHINDNSIPSSSQSYIQSLSTTERLRLVLSLWPYMIPLFTVYAAEYALQAGTWTAIGFPVDEKESRDQFYAYSNWLYQAGVFVSRTSGAFFTAPMWVLWLMPFLQCVNLIFFYAVATTHFWYNYTLLIPCFYVGLLGGAVYVNGFTRINLDLPVETREFALSSASVADTFGIVFADSVSLFIQSCLYQANSIDGAAVQCPVGGKN
mmetsp:Transcript_25528/g.37454  ORF Transcript_25528/g.37454 Transcript_25528/m.37454 type:complete len:502 (+) Transcript_25528:253-1758(+)